MPKNQSISKTLDYILPDIVRKKPRNAQLSRAKILEVAQLEFLTHGLNGARIDLIAKKSDVNKNLIYHYFESKEKLYLAVLEHVYVDLRAKQNDELLIKMHPIEAMIKLVGSTYDHFVNTPDLIRLMSVENIHYARNLINSIEVKPLYRDLVSTLSQILERGKKDKIFRQDIDVIDLYLSISGLAYFFLSNQYTLSWLLDCSLVDKKRIKKRREHVIDMVLIYLIQEKTFNESKFKINETEKGVDK